MEFLALYTNDDKLTNEKIDRKKRFEMDNDLNYRIVIFFIQNSKNEFLIQKVSKGKGGVYATTGGHVIYGDSSLDTVIKETKEELGTDISCDDIKLVKTYKYPHIFQDAYYLKKDINLNDIKLQVEEVESVSYLTEKEIECLIKENKFRQSNIEPFYDILNYQKNFHTYF